MATVVIIGASRGLGRGLVTEHLRRGWDVIATVRNPSDRDYPTERLTTELLDATDRAGIEVLRQRLPHPVEPLGAPAVGCPGAFLLRSGSRSPQRATGLGYVARVHRSRPRRLGKTLAEVRGDESLLA
ncbi:hypothetical protein [Nocardia terpenica]|uniref:SDR family NAD(P)-dependent oxidoreductase n=1 Tax=Nocardia terpenica TaxID=455432 RepID=A0A6G9YUS8_9NOCA|nr:hypothetical protein [Nocardia terpenica]QIS16968.1 hypothetical protein F6W96_00175 [Nocardia terpenica]